MSQANSALITSERAAPTRRALLCTAVPVALAATLPEIPLLGLPARAAGALQGPSRAFLEYRKCHTEWLTACDGPCGALGSPEEAAFDALTGESIDAMWAAIQPIMKRTPQSWQDVIELAQVVYDQLWDEGGKHSTNRELEGSLFDAIFAMAEGGAHA